MEVILLIILSMILASAMTLNIIKELIKQFKSSGSAKFGGFEAKVSVVPIDDKKSEDVRSHYPH